LTVAPLQPALSVCDPFLAGLDHRRFAGCVDSGLDVDLDAGVVRVRVLLAVKGLQPAHALLVGVVDDPGFLGLAQASDPFPLAYQAV
jgi:hypothetical protein